MAQPANRENEWSKTPPQGQSNQGQQSRQQGAGASPQRGQHNVSVTNWGRQPGDMSRQSPQKNSPGKPPPTSGSRPQQNESRGQPGSQSNGQSQSGPGYGQDRNQVSRQTSGRQSGFESYEAYNADTAIPLPRQAQQDARKKQQQAKQQKPQQDDERDTVIGKGFTAAMKRGVAQAKPNALHEELVAQKDGGFISTIQRGFEGLFGKPTSKEEVLRKRGAVWANEYEAVPGDEIDNRVQYFARMLPEDVSGCLKIFREQKGQYTINEEIVNMEVRFRQNPQGQTDKEIFVFWTTEEGEQSDPEPLGLYLQHAANVAYEVKQGGNVITMVPEHARISFHEEVGTKLTDGSADARFNAMEVAARQAKMREEAANEWREKQAKRDDEPEESEQAEQGPAKLQDRSPSAEAAPASMLDNALAAFGILPGVGPVVNGPARSSAAPAPPPVALPAAGQRMSGMPMGASAPSQAGTFYGVSQASPGSMYTSGSSMYASGQYMPRQGTMYAYGSAAPVTTSYGPGPVRQGTMYAYGSASPVPVR